jgi:outer membrane protein TolC
MKRSVMISFTLLCLIASCAPVGSNDLAVQLAMERCLAGLQTYLAVIDALAAQYTAQDELAQSRQNLARGFVALYKALGGGWLDFYGEEGQNSN